MLLLLFADCLLLVLFARNDEFAHLDHFLGAKQLEKVFSSKEKIRKKG